MSKTYRPWDPEQSWLLPPSPRDWLPEDDLVYFVLDTVAELDLAAITRVYEREDRGYPPYHPRMMVTLLLYSYTQGVFSSRRIMRRCERDAAWRVIVGADVPDFRTISEFRRRHLSALEGLFVQVLRLCQRAGLVKLGHVALDGTKIKANASRHKAMSYGRMKEEEKRLRQEIRELLKRAEGSDTADDAQYGVDVRGDELPEALARRQSRLKTIRAAREALEAEARAAAEAEQPRQQAQATQRDDSSGSGPPAGRKACDGRSKGGKRSGGEPVDPQKARPPDKAQYNFTDPETKIMKTSNKGFDQCGNAQAVVDRDHGVIVAADVTNQANDKQQFEPMVTQAQRNVGRRGRLKTVSADNGYFSELNVRWAEASRLDAHIATGRLKHGERVPASPRGRPPAGLTVKETMARKLRTQRGRETYAERKWIVEPVFGFIKRGLGFRQFLLNGLAKMRGEWRLVCVACNLRRLWAAT